MSIESESDWAGLRRVARVARLTLDALEDAVAVGTSTRALDQIAARLFAQHGARSAPALVYRFPGTVLISINDEIVHGIPGERRLQRGDLVKLDVTVEKDGYIADAARSVIVEQGSAAAERLVACAKAAYHAALSIAQAGTRVNEVSRVIEREVRRWGFTVVRGLSGHGVGRTIHEPPDIPNEYDPHQRDVLTEGLVITIEPMISAGSRRPVTAADGWTIRTHDGSWASHYEHTLVITRGAPVVLTDAA
jgi:methionyl aminopeptidase